MTVFLTGLLTCLALSAAIGAQSAFVLRQAIRREHLAAVLAVCIAGDAVLIFAGTAGVGVVTDRAPWLLEVLRWGGAAYLVWFALSSFRSAFTTQRLTVDVSDEPAEPADVSESAALVVPTEVIESPAPEPFAAPREGGVALATRTDARPDTSAWPRITPRRPAWRIRRSIVQRATGKPSRSICHISASSASDRLRAGGVNLRSEPLSSTSSSRSRKYCGQASAQTSAPLARSAARYFATSGCDT